MVIKHLVFSGGGPIGLISYGAAKQLNKKKFWEIENIETIYGTSVGAYMGTLISLGMNGTGLTIILLKDLGVKLSILKL